MQLLPNKMHHVSRSAAIINRISAHFTSKRRVCLHSAKNFLGGGLYNYSFYLFLSFSFHKMSEMFSFHFASSAPRAVRKHTLGLYHQRFLPKSAACDQLFFAECLLYNFELNVHEKQTTSDMPWRRTTGHVGDVLRGEWVTNSYIHESIGKCNRIGFKLVVLLKTYRSCVAMFVFKKPADAFKMRFDNSIGEEVTHVHHPSVPHVSTACPFATPQCAFMRDTLTRNTPNYPSIKHEPASQHNSVLRDAYISSKNMQFPFYS